MIILGHRGVTDKENTYDSITGIVNIAKKYPTAKWGVEFDVQMTKNGNIVCYHDKTLLRIHNRNDTVYDADLNNLNICKLDDILDYELYSSSNVIFIILLIIPIYMLI